MNQLEQSQLSVSEMVEGQEYVFNGFFFGSCRSNEKTIIKKEGLHFYVTYSGGEFEQDQTVVFNTDAFAWLDYMDNVSDLTISDIEEASVDFYNLVMSGKKDDEMAKHVKVICER